VQAIVAKTKAAAAPLQRALASSSAWREAGCATLRAPIAAATVEIGTTLPAQIATGLGFLRAKGMNASPRDAANEKLSRGDVKGAALAYDAAVATVEGI